MQDVLKGFLERNLSEFKDSFEIKIEKSEKEKYEITAVNGKVFVTASTVVAACNGIYDYLKKHCNVQLSWCGNKEIAIESLKMFEGKMIKEIPQKYRVYMNYCTLDYTMCWWDFDRWEKEIDFMAMNGINMPLGVVGSEAIWYETLLELGFTKAEALSSVSGPAFWAWQLMTNIEGYLPPKNEKYVYERLELGRKILARYLEFGMQPIQQGFSGHVPALLKDKFPEANILMQKGWCDYPKTAQLDPLDPLFRRFGTVYLEKLEKLMGNYHFIACDPFHEGTPPKKTMRYLKQVGRAINDLYESFDEKSVWVMQAWTMRKHIVKAVPKERLLVLDLNSEKTLKNRKMWGYPVVAGMLHNFGGKNAMQGKLRYHCANRFLEFRSKKANVVGSGMFMEGIEQNPVIYDLQFELLTAPEKINWSHWLDNYILRRYGKNHPTLRRVWDILLETCYRDDGYNENEVGSALASRPQISPVMTGPCCFSKLFYDADKFEKATALMLSVADEFKDNDGYQYDLCDMVRQALSNRFNTNQKKFAEFYKSKELSKLEEIAKDQLQIILDADKVASHRSEMCFSRWICDSHKLASDEEEKRYFNLNARTLVTLWGDINGNCAYLYDYSWREWSGLMGDYYYYRWEKFYSEVVEALKNGKSFHEKKLDNYATRNNYASYDFGKRLFEYEKEWITRFEEFEYPVDSDVVPTAKQMVEKWNIG